MIDVALSNPLQLSKYCEGTGLNAFTMDCFVQYVTKSQIRRH